MPSGSPLQPHTLQCQFGAARPAEGLGATEKREGAKYATAQQQPDCLDRPPTALPAEAVADPPLPAHPLSQEAGLARTDSLRLQPPRLLPRPRAGPTNKSLSVLLPPPCCWPNRAAPLSRSLPPSPGRRAVEVGYVVSDWYSRRAAVALLCLVAACAGGVEAAVGVVLAEEAVVGSSGGCGGRVRRGQEVRAGTGPGRDRAAGRWRGPRSGLRSPDGQLVIGGPGGG